MMKHAQKFTKTIIFTVLFSILATTAIGINALADTENLLQNADFSVGNNGGSIASWSTVVYEGGGSVNQVISGDSDAPYISLEANKNSDYRLTQTVDCEPSTYYKFSGLIRAQGIQDRTHSGAVLSVPMQIKTSKSIYNTNGKWKKAVIYIKTGENSSKLTVSIGIGGHSSLNSGKASFKNLSLVKFTGQIPPRATVADSGSAEKFDEEHNGKKTSQTSNNEDATFPVGLLIIIILVVVAIIVAVFFLMKKPKNTDETKK